MSTLPTPGLWKVTWGTTSYLMLVSERDGQTWCRDINPAREHGSEPMLLSGREDGGVWQKALLCRVVRRTDVTRRIDTFEEYTSGATREEALANLRTRLDEAEIEVIRIDVLRE